MSDFIEQFLINSKFVCVPTTNVWIHRYKDDVYNLAGRKKIGLSLSVSNCGYLGANINIYDKPRWVPLHLLRAIAFVPFGKYEEIIGEWSSIHDIAKRGITVNHKDGNKLNNADDNLEWATHQENMIHAHKAGLQPNTKAIYVYDIFKREEMYFYSIAQAELHYGWGESAAGRYLKTDRDALFAFRYLIRKSDEPDYVVHLTRHDAWKTVHGTNGITPVAVIDKHTNKRKLYPMRSVAIRSLHLPEIFKRKWNSSDDYIANERYLATPVTDIVELEQLASDYRKISKQGGKTIGGGNKALQVKVTDAHGNVTIYDTLKEAARQLNVPKTTLVIAIHRRNWFGGTIEYIKE